MASTRWRKSSYSMNGGDCAEVSGNWRISSRSFSNGNCVQVADGVLVRDSKDPDGPVLAFSAAAWRDFIRRNKT